jgi:glutathione synthase/RimK-type ligase-like ATP-grasp enzyme
MKKSQEYRVHIFNGEILTVNRKARRNDVENPDWRIRNHANGFIYSRTNFDTPLPVINVANTVTALLSNRTNGRLLFGAIDIIWNHRDNRAYALEINTAPGIEGVLVDQYVEAFRGFVR